MSSETTSSPLLETRSLSVRVGKKQVCRELNFSIQSGERWGILGINGVGKTSLLHTLAGLRPPASGEILLAGTPIHDVPRRQMAMTCGVMLQDSDDVFPGTVMETVLIGRHPHLKPMEWESAQDESIARSALESVGLAGMEQRLTTTLSGGERRRLALATLLTQDPQLFLMDEPVNHLDLHHQIETLGLLTNQAKGHGKTLLMVLHDVNLAQRYCDSLLLLFGNGEVLQGRTEELLNEVNLELLYHHPIRSIKAGNRKLYYPD